MKKIFLKDYGLFLSNRNFHNPNTYNAVDSAIALIIFLITSKLMSYPLQALISKIYNESGDYSLSCIVAAIFSQALIFLIGFSFSKIRRVGIISGGGLIFHISVVDALFGVILALGLYFLLNYVHYYFVNDWTEIIYLTDYNTLNQINSSLISDSNIFFTIFYTIIIVPILPAVCEEILFRGVIMRGLRQLGDLFAIICSGLIFAIMHGSYQQFVIQFAIGIAIGTAVIATDNMFVGMIMHLVYNLSTSVITLTAQIFNGLFAGYNYLYDALGILIGIVFLIVSALYFGNILLEKYRIKVTDSPRITKYRYFYLLGGDSVESGQLYPYSAIIRRYYEKDSILKYYDGTRFVKFNKQSTKKCSIILLSIAIILAIVNVIIASF